MDRDVATDMTCLRRQIRSYLKIQPDNAVLDVGCGRGEDLISLAKDMAEGAKLVGIDSFAESIAAASSLSADDDRLSFIVHDASTGLPFQDDAFDAVMSINLLEAIPDKTALLQEVHRVLRPGGSVVLAHFDWDSQLFDGSDKAAIRGLVHAYGDWKQAWMGDCDAWMGRRLWRTTISTGLFQGKVRPLTLINTDYEPGTYGWEQAQRFRALSRRNLARADRVDEFLTGLEELHRRGEYFYCITMFVFAGHSRERKAD